MILTPTIFSSGKWTLKAPFTLVETDIYVCSSIRSFEELKGSGIDPFKEYYEPRGIPLETYLIDEANYASIITLTSDNQSTVDVPDSYITSVPNRETIPYRHLVLSLSLGGVPDDLLMDDIKLKIEQMVLSDIGITTKVKEHVSGKVVEYVTLQEHRIIESNRKAILANNSSLYTKLSEKDKTISDLTDRITLLETFIKDKGLL